MAFREALSVGCGPFNPVMVCRSTRRVAGTSVVTPADGGGLDFPQVSLWFLRCLLWAGKFPESAGCTAAEANAPTAGCSERGVRAL